MATVVIGCKLPNGLILAHPKNREARVTLAGLHSSKIIGATHATTEVDQDFWNAFKEAHKDYAPITSGAIFEARNVTEAQAKAKETRKEKTGLEPISQDASGVSPDKGK